MRVIVDILVDSAKEIKRNPRLWGLVFFPFLVIFAIEAYLVLQLRWGYELLGDLRLPGLRELMVGLQAFVKTKMFPLIGGEFFLYLGGQELRLVWFNPDVWDMLGEGLRKGFEKKPFETLLVLILLVLPVIAVFYYIILYSKHSARRLGTTPNLLTAVLVAFIYLILAGYLQMLVFVIPAAVSMILVFAVPAASERGLVEGFVRGFSVFKENLWLLVLFFSFFLGLSAVLQLVVIDIVDFALDFFEIGEKVKIPVRNFAFYLVCSLLISLQIVAFSDLYPALRKEL